MNKNSVLTICIALMLGPLAFGQNVVADSLEFGSNTALGPEALLAGRVSGLYVSQTQGGLASLVNTHIRGVNTASGSSNPIWVVDGVILDSFENQQPSAFWQAGYADYSFDGSLNSLQFLNINDIESIEVLKNTSATALYGDRGANGVIIVNTKQAREMGNTFEFRAAGGANLPGNGNGYLKAGFTQNYNLAFNHSGNKTDFRITGFFRDFKGTAPGEDVLAGGLRAKFDTHANKVVKFGMSLSATLGKQQETSLGANYGMPSAGTAFRGLEALDNRKNDAQGWIDGFDDSNSFFRSSDRFNITVTPFNNFNWITSAGIDFQSNRRMIWYDTTTAMGEEFQRAAALTSATLCNAGANSRLKYGFFFAGHHHVDIEAGAEFYFRQLFDNTMNGNHIFTDAMGARGFVYRESFDESAVYRMSYFQHAFFANLSYDWRQQIGLRASVRADRNNHFDSAMVIYPSGEFFWNLHKMFFSSSKAVSDLEIDFGYGKAGKTDYAPYCMTPAYVTGGYPDIVREAQVYYEGWRRVLTEEFNLGLRLGFMDQRLRIGVNAYSRKSADTYNMYETAIERGDKHLWVYLKERRTAFQNVYDITSKGIEFDIDADIIRTRTVDWSLRLNGAFASNQYLGEQIKYSPVRHGGLGTTLRVANFRLDVQTDAAGGCSLYNLNNMLADKGTDMEKYLERADFLRLSNVSLRYDIPVKSKKIKGLFVNLSGRNLATLSSYSGWNPSVSTYGTTNLNGGYDYGSLALPRTIMLGAGINF